MISEHNCNVAWYVMNCESCGRKITNYYNEECHEDNIELGFEALDVSNKNISNMVNTVEFLLICLDCKNQTPYGYLWFAISDGREHVLTTKHKHVTITEIIWQNDKALERLMIEINSAIALHNNKF